MTLTIVRTLAWRAGVGLLGAVALLLAFRLLFVYTLRLHCRTTAGPSTQARAGTQAAPENLVVLSYNVAGHEALLHADHLEQVANVIRAHRPDVVALQEVHRGTWQARFRDQAQELGQRVGMNVFFGPSYGALGGEFGNAVLTRGRIVGTAVIDLPSIGEPRSLLRSTLEIDGAPLDFLVTHLAAWGRLGGRVRSLQVRCLREQIRRSSNAVVFCGDLNAVPGSPEIAELLGGDLVELAGLASESTVPFLRRRYDYVLADPGWRVVEARVLHEGPSDHWPVLVTLAHRAAPGPRTSL